MESYAYTYPVQKNAITVKLVGGLGNQLFIWAAAYSISKKQNLELIIDASECTQRGFELDIFGIKAAIKPNNPPNGILPTRFPKSQSKLLKFFRACRGKFRYLRIGKNFWERPGGFDPTVFSIPAGKTLRGYFQSYKYFQDFLPEILEYLTLNIKTSSRYHDILGNLKDEQWVAIHVRRGDYKQVSSSFGLVPEDYYHQALTRVESYFPNLKKYVFTDDIFESKILLPGCDGYISDNELGSGAERMLLSSHADALIGANSTFSWWTAILMSAEEHLKIFPDPWFAAKSLENKDFIPVGWGKIPIILDTSTY